MKKFLPLIMLGVLLSSYHATAQVVDPVIITRETFGDTSWDINSARVPRDWFPDGFTRESDSATHFKAWQINTFTSLNGEIRGGLSDNSVRINSYDEPFLTTKPEHWRDPSGIHHLHKGFRTGWMGSWDTTFFQGINIAGYDVDAIEFGFIRARTHGSNDLRWISVHYRVDGGEWIQVDTTLYAPPVTAAQNTWFYIQASIFIENAQTLDIRFSTIRSDEQVYIDDITVMGFPTMTFVPVTTLAVTSPAETVEVGGTLQMSADALPAEATNKAVRWSVDTLTRATISATGLLTGVGEGTVVVTATTSSVPTVTATKTITVTAPPPVGVPTVGSAFTLYPVPVESQLFISSDVAVERIEVFSIDGRVLVSKVLAGGNSVDLSALRTGTYIARITKVNGEVVTRSILKK